MLTFDILQAMYMFTKILYIYIYIKNMVLQVKRLYRSWCHEFCRGSMEAFMELV